MFETQKSRNTTNLGEIGQVVQNIFASSSQYLRYLHPIPNMNCKKSLHYYLFKDTTLLHLSKFGEISFQQYGSEGSSVGLLR